MKGIDVALGVGGVLVVGLMVFVVHRARTENASPRTGAAASATVAVPAARRRPAGYYEDGEPLPPGLACSAARGYVYRYGYRPDGSARVEYVRRKGNLVRCSGGPGATPRR